MFKKVPPFTIALFFILSLAASLFSSSTASAVTASDWRAGRIIDDSIFTDKNAMTTDQIQAFLNSKVGTGGYGRIAGQCDTWGEKTSEFGGGTRAQYGASRGNPAPFTCLKDYYEVPKVNPGPGVPASNYGGTAIPAGAKSSAQLIWDASQRYNISPKTLLVTIQKESAGPLTTDDWPFKSQYTYAMGARCPDSGPGGSANCDENYAGFSMQIMESARLFRYYLDSMSQPWWPYKKPGNNTVLYNPNRDCGSSNIYIETMATAALYTYTPYQPNQAALNNMYGSGDACSAYGNRNFWRIFNEWFGSTSGPDYSWAIESFIYSGGDNNIAIGQTETVTLKARNNGRQPWYNHGNHPVRLGTWEPADRTSSLFGTNRLATMQESGVQPGQIGTFTFQISPQKIGTFIEGLNLVAENHQWIKWPGLRPTINVTSPYQWHINSVIYEKGTGLMEPGSQQLITVIAKNTGSITWNKLGGAPVRLGTWQPERKSSVSRTWPSVTRAADMNETTVEPGQNAGFQFYVTMPSSGNFYEKLNLVAEGQTWLNNPGLTLYLQGKTYAWQPVWHSHSTGTANIARNSEFTLRVKVKNTGEMPWKKDSFPVRLGTAAPLNRGSSIYHSSWIRDTRPAALIEDTVLPGEEGTFLFTAKTPSTPGPRTERFSLVAEGLLWLNDPGFSIYVNVL